MDRDAAIATAKRYLGSDADGLWVETATRIDAKQDDDAIATVASALGRALDEMETDLTLQYNRDHWLLQFVFVATERGDTPQGPAVSVFDDGDIRSMRPM
ncbi:MAG: hypothetical protein AB8B55_20310 [Mariniblastus sp.]